MHVQNISIFICILINANYDYSINDNQQIGLALVGSKKFNSANRNISYTTLDDQGKIIYDSYKEIDISLDNYSIDGDLDYQYRMKKKGQSL